MPAIDAALPTPPTASAELRPASQTKATSAKPAASDAQGSEAFIAALLAQSIMPQADPAVPVAIAESAAPPAGGQELPTMRPTLATPGTPRRAVGPLLADNAPLAPSTGPAVLDSAEQEFASAFVAQRKAMTAGGEFATPTDADSATPISSAASTGTALLSDLTSSGSAGQARGEQAANQAVDTLAGAHAARNHEATAPATTHAAKPAPLPMDQPALFAERLNQHISFMLGDHIQTAQIVVTPADLGPVEVRVTLVGDEAKIQLTATHAATREALNEALPRLRASLAEAGISLSQAGVFAQMPERQQAEPSLGGQSGRNGERDFEHTPLSGVAPTRSLSVGLIDAFV